MAVLAERLRGVVDGVLRSGDWRQVGGVDADGSAALMVHVLTEGEPQQAADKPMREPGPLAVEDEVDLAVAVRGWLALPEPVSIADADLFDGPWLGGRSERVVLDVHRQREVEPRQRRRYARCCWDHQQYLPVPGHFGATSHAYHSTPNTEA